MPPGNGSYIKCSNVQVQNTAGGTATSGSWTNIPLNTKDVDSGSIATLSGNQISIPAGTYDVLATEPFYKIDQAQTRLYNATDSSVIMLGTGIQSGNGGTYATGTSVVVGQFTIAGTKAIAFQYNVITTENTDGLGKATNIGQEVYAQVQLVKVK